MSKLKIAFQGEPGANSHIAIVEAYPDAEPMPCATFEDALSAISSGEADLGMIPIENSVAGRVADIHHLLPASTARSCSRLSCSSRGEGGSDTNRSSAARR